MKLEDLTGDDRTLVVVALRALFRERSNSYHAACTACQLAGEKPPAENLLAWRKVFRQFAGWELSRRDEARYEINQ